MKEKCTFTFGLADNLHTMHGNSMAHFPNEDGEIRTLSFTNNTYKDGLQYNEL